MSAPVRYRIVPRSPEAHLFEVACGVDDTWTAGKGGTCDVEIGPVDAGIVSASARGPVGTGAVSERNGSNSSRS